MNGYPFNMGLNPYPATMNLYQPPAPQMEIPKVNGEEGAKAFPIGANSSVILMDNNNPLIWVVVTDAAAVKTVTPFSITQYVPEQPVTASDIDAKLQGVTERLTHLEERIGRYESNLKPADQG